MPFTLEGEDPELSTLSFFSTLTITANIDKEKSLFSLDLSRSEAFPSRRFETHNYLFHPCEAFIAYPVPHDAAHLQLALGECLGEGRTGKVYSAHVLGPLPNLPSPIPSELVVKFAKLNHCRNLAREAWVYNFLDRQTKYEPVGTIVPRCYGFFTAKLADCDLDLDLDPLVEDELPWSIPEWEEYPEQDDTLTDDNEDEIVEPSEWALEEWITKDRSKWNTWEPDPEDPLVAVILLEKGGETYSQIDDKDPLVREDVELALWDLVHAGVVHDDFRMANIVRAPTTAKFCRRHERVHQWCIIDFNRAWVVDLGREQLPSALKLMHSFIGYQEMYFYGWNPND
ncbi:hypothetical protein GYMLUDRAFT_100112 [Collybiopsis luxurians FD-317 M1]|uniref:Protein kinase domain-containing protein n=1 Tax=Collybiopsis luxurians FD-317 M1 TaxID=944289 RepID=A0A0D0BXD3_9AGAR|nr:hypothetical protein GYMLUDRAFT_100112 [Collybiopsis luxurians FD-317 M1]